MTQARQRVLIACFIILGIVVAGFFGMRAFHAVREFRGHRPPPRGQIETDVSLIRDWMTIPFISKLYHVPPNLLFDAVQILPEGNKEKSLKYLNDEYYPEADGFVLEKIKSVILENQPPPEQPKTSVPSATARPPQP